MSLWIIYVTIAHAKLSENIYVIVLFLVVYLLPFF